MHKNKLILFLFLSLLLFLTGCIPGISGITNMQTLGNTMGPKFIAHGASSIDVSNVFHQLEEQRSTDNWSVKWSELARDYEYRGEKELEENNLENARFLLLKASVYYRIAAYPYPLEAKRIVADAKARELFKQSVKFTERPPQIITTIAETRKITGYLRKPTLTQKVPLVVLLPGIDSNKEEMFWLEDHFLDKGFATFSIDIPGSGESEWRLHDDSGKMLQKAINYVQQDSSILKNKTAIVGFNFGGYWALRLAALEQNNINCLAVVDTPVHHTFAGGNLRKMPRFMADIFLKACGAVDYNNMYKTLENLSLKKKDILRDIKQPLLVIASEENILIPREDILIFSREMKRAVSFKLYDKGVLGVINNLQNEVYPLIADWVEKQFEL